MVGAVGGVGSVTQKTAVVSGPSRGAGNAAKTITVQQGITVRTEDAMHLLFLQLCPAKTITVQQGITVRTEDALHLDPMATAVFPTLTVPRVIAVVLGPSRDVENAARLPTAPLEFIALKEPADFNCPKGLSAGRTRTASPDAVQEKFTHGQVADALALENHVVYQKEGGALN